MEMNVEMQNALLALNEEQKAIMEEMKNVCEKMKKANMIILFDSFNISLSVINGEHIEDVNDDCTADEEVAVEMDDECKNWGNMDFIFTNEFRSTYENPMITFKSPIVTDVRNKVQMQQSMDSALL